MAGVPQKLGHEAKYSWVVEEGGRERERSEAATGSLRSDFR